MTRGAPECWKHSAGLVRSSRRKASGKRFMELALCLGYDRSAGSTRQASCGARAGRANPTNVRPWPNVPPLRGLGRTFHHSGALAERSINASSLASVSLLSELAGERFVTLKRFHLDTRSSPRSPARETAIFAVILKDFSGLSPKSPHRAGFQSKHQGSTSTGVGLSLFELPSPS